MEMETEMEMRAREDTDMAEDLTQPIPPIATSLHDPFLHSHCSSCFRPLSPTQPYSGTTPTNPVNPDPIPPSCPTCNASVLYCSRDCSVSDSDRHVSSGECRLFCLLLDCTYLSTWQPGDTADLRAALRLMYSFERLGFLPPPPPRKKSPRRIGWLLASNREEMLEEGCEISERIREGGELMWRARNREQVRNERSVDGGEVLMEEEVLLVVLTNAVEVQVSGAGTIGIAVYGPRFSWFNHSCSPNACYRFEFAEAPGSCDPGFLRVLPAGTGEAAVDAAVWKTWIDGESKLNHGLCIYAPRIVVRSIKPIRKGEAVFITYTDLLQPKAVRHLELWTKYRFVCCCERCSSSPHAYADYILDENASNLNAMNLSSDHNNYSDVACDELADSLDQVITEYMSDGNSEGCCEKLENMLSESFQDGQFHVEEPLHRKFRLHPLHHLSLNAYLTLASAYRIRTSNLLAIGLCEENILEAFKMGRAAAAYSVLLAGATHHLFMSESSLIATATLFWISAGESMLGLVRSSTWGSTKFISESEFSMASHCSWGTTKQGEGSTVLWDEFVEKSTRFLGCVSSILSKLWPFLVQDLPYLKDIKSPVDFSYLGKAKAPCHAVAGGRDATVFVLCYKIEEECSGCKFKAEVCIEEARKSLFEIAVHCLAYGKYLASICYSPRCYLIDGIINLPYGSLR